MEQNLAILIVDLSGYTALTETHGPRTAADLIDTFLRIVSNSLVGSTQLHEKIGDEVLLIASSPADLLATAILLSKNSRQENNFLLLHGGLHYGNLLKRNNNYFGSAINFTARIAAKAPTGAFWCSKEFMDATSLAIDCRFESQGLFEFKNMPEKKEIFHIVCSDNNELIVDPVCRMLILAKENAVHDISFANLFFCSQTCLDSYRQTNEIQSPLL